MPRLTGISLWWPLHEDTLGTLSSWWFGASRVSGGTGIGAQNDGCPQGLPPPPIFSQEEVCFITCPECSIIPWPTPACLSYLHIVPSSLQFCSSPSGPQRRAPSAHCSHDSWCSQPEAQDPARSNIRRVPGPLTGPLALNRISCPFFWG